jgi:Siphovirus ReqiPepy6 Gp37-like protein
LTKLQINIYTTDFVWTGIIEDVQSLVLRTSWHEIVNSELVVNRYAQGVEELQLGRVLVINNDREKAVIIEDMETSLNDENWTFTLIPCKALMNYRIANPTDSADFTQKRQANVMMNLVKSNVVDNVRDTKRNFLGVDGITNRLAVASVKEYGDLIDFKVDWDTGYLGDMLVEIAKMNEDASYPIGWNVYIHSGWALFYLNTYLATNRTVNQVINPPVVFSEEFGNLKNATYSHSIKEWRNAAYMNYNNGTADLNFLVNKYKDGTPSSFNRKEIVLDSSKKTQQQTINVGKAELNKRPKIKSFSAEIINNPNTISTYNVDWFLGDVVTIQSAAILKNQLLSVDAQITEIEETYDQGEYSLNVTFGEGQLNFIQMIKNKIKEK